MTTILASLLLDPKTLAVILTAFGGAIGWLIKNDRSCKRDKAVLEERMSAMRERIATAEGTIKTLCTLLKREVHIG